MASLKETAVIRIKKILFPTDFSPNANRALLHALQLADFQHGEVIVQHVVDDYFEKHNHWAALFDVHAFQRYLESYIDAEMKRSLPRDSKDIVVTHVLSKGKPAEEIAALADAEDVDFVVMGSARGVITGKVIRLTTRPVFAISARPGAKESNLSKIKRILVATDFSEHSNRVIRYAFDLKRIFNAGICMMHVIETPKLFGFDIRPVHWNETVERMREWAGNQLLSLTPEEFINDRSVVRIVESGAASDRIADIANEIEADLTILGTHEYGKVQRHLLGTTTDRVLSKLSSPILTVKL
jgi:nucleotide-binding universal stress UspA family protein